MRLLLACDSFDSPADAARGDSVLAFDRLAFESLRGADNAYFVDDLLDWNERIVVELAVGSVLESLTSDRVVAETEIDGYPLLAAARYDLRMAVTDLLRAYHAVTRLPCRDRLDGIDASRSCSYAIRLGAAAAVGLDADAVHPRPTTPRKRPPGLRAANALLRGYADVRSARNVRVLAFPGGKVTAALASLSATQLRRDAVGVATFPVLVGGGAVRLALAKGVPVVAADRAADRPTESPVPIERLAEEPFLDAALRRLVTHVLARVAPTVARAAASASALESCTSCRAVVLPTVAVPTAHVARTWARRRGTTCVVVQHGIHVFRDWHGGDEDADVLLGWGEAVEALFNGSRPTFRCIGTPGLRGLARPATTRVRRIVVTTTNAPTGSALGLSGFCEAFVSALLPSLPRLLDAGISVDFRLHPAEDPRRYALMLGGLSRRVRISSSGPLATTLAHADLVVSSLSSAATEAAGSGLPVVLWLGWAPPSVRRRFMLPPLDRELPSAFADAAEFRALTDELLVSPTQVLRRADELTAILASYARPFDPGRFAEELERLAG